MSNKHANANCKLTCEIRAKPKQPPKRHRGDRCKTVQQRTPKKEHGCCGGHHDEREKPTEATTTSTTTPTHTTPGKTDTDKKIKQSNTIESDTAKQILLSYDSDRRRPLVSTKAATIHQNFTSSRHPYSWNGIVKRTQAIFLAQLKHGQEAGAEAVSSLSRNWRIMVVSRRRSERTKNCSDCTRASMKKAPLTPRTEEIKIQFVLDATT